VRNNQKILIIVENLTMPLDRRVWQEARTLHDAGYTVSVICPKSGSYTKSYEILEGIHVFRHPQPFEADGALGYALEYTNALFWEFVLSIRVRLKIGFDVIEACNPPDLIFIIAAFWKYLFGTPFIFDHHDINPELYEAKFRKRGFFYELLKKFERWTFKTADVSIATNDTFKQIAMERGQMDKDKVFVVRSVPDLSRFKRCAPSNNLKQGRKYLIGYVGVIGAQDGVDLLIHAMAELVHLKGRKDIQCAIVGSGTELKQLKQLAVDLRVDDHITFPGFLSGVSLLGAFSAFDIGVIPDPKNSYNDKISMNKVFEYMAMGIAFVQFDLSEGKRAAGSSALYARNNDPRDLAHQLGRLIDNPKLCAKLGAIGRERAKTLLNWESERVRLLAVYETALKGDSSTSLAAAPLPAGQR